MQNQQLLFLTAQAPDGYKLICTGTEMRWVSTQQNASSNGDDQAQFVFADIPELSIADDGSSTHHHHHDEMDMPADDQQANLRDFQQTAAFMELACPEQTFLELQQTSGLTSSGILVSFVDQYNHYEPLPIPPYVCFHYAQQLSRGPPVKNA